MDRRTFLKAGAAITPLVGLSALRAQQPAARRPVVISSHADPRVVNVVMERLEKGADPLEAAVSAVTMVEDDPNDGSTGIGGLPNEAGVVELDASVMHGPTHTAGAVASLRNIRNPSRVAMEVLKRTDHVLLVGECALRFATAIGFREENILTEKARESWMRSKASRAPDDDWLDPGWQLEIPHSSGTIHCAAMDARGDLGACTSTSGKSYSLPGRVGDTPIVGAGLYVDNEVGTAGSVGLGEHVVRSAGSFQVVDDMGRGMEPTDACLAALRWIADHTTLPRLLNKRGEPRFGVAFYALRRDGAYGAAVMRGRPSFGIHDGHEARRVQCTALFG